MIDKIIVDSLLEQKEKINVLGQSDALQQMEVEIINQKINTIGQAIAEIQLKLELMGGM